MARAGLLSLLLALWGAAPATAADEARPWLIALESPDPQRRLEAAARLGEIRDPAQADAVLGGLLRALEDPQPPVRHQAALALAGRRDRRALGPLLAQLGRERQVQVLPALLLAVGDLGGPAEVDVLLPFARTHPQATVRAAGLTALGKLGGERARQAALETLTRLELPDRDWSLRAAAMLALSHCGRTEDVGGVLVAYREGDGARHWFARSALARLVASLDRDPVPLLTRMTGDPDARVAVTAAEGLARAGREDVLLSLLDHLVPAVRSAAAHGIAQAHLTVALPKLRALARLDRSRDVRWAAALALFRMEDPAGDALVLEGLDSNDASVWAEALAVLVARTGAHHGRDVRSWRVALARWRADR